MAAKVAADEPERLAFDADPIARRVGRAGQGVGAHGDRGAGAGNSEREVLPRGRLRKGFAVIAHEVVRGDRRALLGHVADPKGPEARPCRRRPGRYASWRARLRLAVGG